ncbi:MAG: hypothetical protein K9N09_07025 [Candidatus Cloacimonetes bacterium]|nr:hypothetical protein [Candidatus Cloacimonadota bacterium]MCF7814230.1 hypothetical protein [Candidatus Cloacimonadota bacterium]MCF7868437.1 hypothetical protein [Candidatus Cloacimonadota bacterium]MCF7883943.1 hypothetical protein [Candidatus Cloacimonadota bacterium]
MIDLEKQIKYWLESAQDDLETANILIDQNKILQGLFSVTWLLKKH